MSSSNKEKVGKKSGKQLFKSLPTPVKSSQSHFKESNFGMFIFGFFHTSRLQPFLELRPHLYVR